MAERGWGRIINVGSQQTWSAFGRSGVYGVAKAGVGGLSRSQAEAWSDRGVTSNTLVPGFVVTPMTAATVAEPGREAAGSGLRAGRRLDQGGTLAADVRHALRRFVDRYRPLDHFDLTSHPSNRRDELRLVSGRLVARERGIPAADR